MNVDDVLELNADLNLAAAPPTAPPAPVVPTHNYEFREGDAYGYIAAVSDEERAKGKRAGDVLMYRYLGKSDGLHRMELLTADGAVLSQSECADPCAAIKIRSRNGVSQLAYDPGSVIGGAFQDAMTGKLKTHQPEPEVDYTALRGRYEEPVSPVPDQPAAPAVEPVGNNGEL